MEALSLVRFIHHGCVCFSDGKSVVYADPFLLPKDAPAADLVFITHNHSDHYSPKNLKKICTPQTHFATTAEVAALLPRDLNVSDQQITILKPGAPRADFPCGASAEAVPAVNKNHPAGFGFGIVLTFGGFTYYISGDTDTLAPNIPCDVLFVVCDGIWNMPHYAKVVPAQLSAMRTRPALVVPYHYGSYAPGTGRNGRKLCDALAAAGIPCREFPA